MKLLKLRRDVVLEALDIDGNVIPARGNRLGEERHEHRWRG